MGISPITKHSGTRSKQNQGIAQQFTRPIVRVDVSSGKVLLNDIRSFWERQVVQSLEPPKSA
jgi:hypothetical protein